MDILMMVLLGSAIGLIIAGFLIFNNRSLELGSLIGVFPIIGGIVIALIAVVIFLCSGHLHVSVT